MPRFWKRRHDEPVDALLKANRPVPRDEFVAAAVERIESERPRFHVRGLGRRLVLAVAVTALAVGAAAAAGGVKSATDGVGTLVDVAKKTIVPPPQANSSSSAQGNQQGVNQSGSQGGNQQNGSNDQGGNNQDNQGESPGDHQYAVTICHHTSSATNPWVELTLSPQGAAAHLRNHPDDYIVTPTHPCLTKKNP